MVSSTFNSKERKFQMLFMDGIYRFDLILDEYYNSDIYVIFNFIQDKNYAFDFKISRTTERGITTKFIELKDTRMNYQPNVVYRTAGKNGNYEAEIHIVYVTF